MATAPVFFIVGDDDHLLRRASERVLADLRASEPDLDIEHLDAGEADELPELRTASLFGGGRCVVIRRLEAPKAALKEQLEDYCTSPDPEATLVLIARGTQRIPKLAKLATSAGEKIEVARPTPWDTKGWQRLVSDEFRTAGRKADAAAIDALLEVAGVDPAIIASKVSQLAAVKGPNETITVEDVEKTIEGHGNRGAFAVADAVEQRDPGEAIVALRGALEAGEAPLAVLGALTSRFRHLLGARAGLDARTIRVSPGRHRMLSQAARRFNPGELAWCHDRLAQADLDLKGSDLPSDLLIELAVIEVATAREVGRPWNPLAS